MNNNKQQRSIHYNYITVTYVVDLCGQLQGEIGVPVYLALVNPQIVLAQWLAVSKGNLAGPDSGDVNEESTLQTV